MFLFINNLNELLPVFAEQLLYELYSMRQSIREAMLELLKSETAGSNNSQQFKLRTYLRFLKKYIPRDKTDQSTFCNIM